MAARWWPFAWAGAAAVAGCSYDWTVDKNGPALDGSASDVMTHPDVDVPEAGSTDSSAGDVASGEAGPADTGAPPAEAGSNCAQLTQKLQQALAAAVACNPLMACTTQVTDECGCKVWVGTLAPTSQLPDAVAAFESASCSTSSLCTGSCPTTATSPCIYQDGGTAGATCYQ